MWPLLCTQGMFDFLGPYLNIFTNHELKCDPSTCLGSVTLRERKRSDSQSRQLTFPTVHILPTPHRNQKNIDKIKTGGNSGLSEPGADLLDSFHTFRFCYSKTPSNPPGDVTHSDAWTSSHFKFRSTSEERNVSVRTETEIHFLRTCPQNTNN